MTQSKTSFALSAIGLVLSVTPVFAGFPFFGRSNDCLPTRQEFGPPNAAAAPRGAPAPDENEDEDELQSAVAAPARGPVLFSIPAPTGEITGARSSFELPSLRMTLPKFAFETPSLRLNGGARVKRDAQMDIDGATAGAAAGPPVIHAPLLGAGFQQPQLRPRGAGAPAAAPAGSKPPTEPEAAPASQNHCAPGCTQNQSDEVQQLSLQVQQLQALILQLAEQKAAQGGEAVDQMELGDEVGSVPPKSRVVAKSVSRSSQSRDLEQERELQLQREEELAALEAEEAARQQEFEESYAQKMAELDAMQSRMEQLELQEKRVLEAKLQKIASDRERRLRSRMSTPATREPRIIQSSFADEEVAEDLPEPAPPRKMFARPTSMKAISSPVRTRAAAVEYDDAELPE